MSSCSKLGKAGTAVEATKKETAKEPARKG